MNIVEIVADWLRSNGYDGLYIDECGCRLEDLMPCCEDCRHCEAGVSVGTPEDAAAAGVDFFIGSKAVKAAEEGR